MKKKSILFMLVFALLFMFLSGVSATEHADVQSSDSVSVEHAAPEKNLDTVSNHDVGKKASEQVSSDESYQSSDKQVSKKKSDTQVSKKKSDTQVSNKKSDAQVTSNKNTSQENKNPIKN